MLKTYSNFRRFNKVIDYEVKKGTPLVAIVYGLYGSLDFYDAIRTINVFIGHLFLGNKYVYRGIKKFLGFDILYISFNSQSK